MFFLFVFLALKFFFLSQLNGRVGSLGYQVQISQVIKWLRLYACPAAQDPSQTLNATILWLKLLSP